jgi:putative transposase
MADWPHAPPHMLRDQGIYMVTAATYLKAHHFQSQERLQLLHDRLLSLSKAFEWELHAWAVFSNPYHFVARSSTDPSHLKKWIAQLHHSTAAQLNAADHTPNRQVWFQYWDSKITIHTSYLARLNYVHQNAVKHGLVPIASHYPWCSASQFENRANRSFVKSVYSFDCSKVNVTDDF